MTKFLQGTAVSDGIAMGPVVFRKKPKLTTKCRRVVNPEAEIERLCSAVKCAKEELLGLREKALQTAGGHDAEEMKTMMESYLLLLEDASFHDAVVNRIYTEQVNAEYAVEKSGEQYRNMLAGMEDAYMRERAADIRDIADCILRKLYGAENVQPTWEHPSIVVTDEISPSEMMQLDREKVLALVTVNGSYYSHVSILARNLGIPAITGVSSAWEEEEIFAIADAQNGLLIVNPEAETVDEYRRRSKKEQENKVLLEEYRGLESITRDGQKIAICANVGNALEVRQAMEQGADGIGLFRSEFLYIGRDSSPLEEEQFKEYRTAVEMAAQKQIVIRTMDLGADKAVTYLDWDEEENPALGYRGIRICLKERELFKEQLKALLRAAVYGNLAILYPMITSVEEVEQIQEILKEAAKELESRKVSYRIPEQGVMIETPAAVLISDELAEKVDFFSIGTNDLTQYTLAVDRQNAKLEDIYRPHHKAILKMIHMVVENAHKVGKKVGICGELAADMALTKAFLQMGVDELSVASGKICALRKAVREMGGRNE